MVTGSIMAKAIGPGNTEKAIITAQIRAEEMDMDSTTIITSATALITVTMDITVTMATTVTTAITAITTVITTDVKPALVWLPSSSSYSPAASAPAEREEDAVSL